MRGDVFILNADQSTRGHEQRGRRFAVVLIDHRFEHLSTWLVAPTSTRAQPYIFRPRIEIPGHGETLALCDALRSVDVSTRLGERVGIISLADLDSIDAAVFRLMGYIPPTL